jgi:DNA-binding MarR family transcriptional regulator
MDTRDIRRFRRVLRSFERLNQVQLKSCCSRVTLAQCLVLLETEEAGRPTMGELAARLRLDNSTLSRTVDGLVERGCLARERDDRDRRAVWVRLTAEGVAVCRSIHKENDAYYRRVLRRIPPSRRAAVLRGFETLVRAFLDDEAAALVENSGRKEVPS